MLKTWRLTVDQCSNKILNTNKSTKLLCKQPKYLCVTYIINNLQFYFVIVAQ